jgi:hypothetical protein
MNFDMLLEQTVEEELLLGEAAKTEQELSSGGYGLYIQRTGPKVSFVLYSTNLVRDIQTAIVGYNEIHFSPDCGNWKEKYIGALRGYGPLLYDIAMSYISPDSLRADTTYVSLQAQNVWNYMFNNRRDDFNITEIKDKACKSTVLQGGSKLSAVKYAYAIKNPVDFSNLVNNHEKLVSRFSSRERFEKRLFDEGVKFVNKHLT